MNNGLHRLVYYSRNRVGQDPQTLSAAIKSILSASRRNNAQVDVTGALMFNSGCFAQVLEGGRAAVESVFERVQQDERHGDVAVLAFEPVKTRSFDKWSMGFVGASPDDIARYDTLAEASGFDPARMTGEALFQTLHSLALEEEGKQ